MTAVWLAMSYFPYQFLGHLIRKAEQIAIRMILECDCSQKSRAIAQADGLIIYFKHFIIEILSGSTSVDVTWRFPSRKNTPTKQKNSTYDPRSYIRCRRSFSLIETFPKINTKAISIPALIFFFKKKTDSIWSCQNSPKSVVVFPSR